MNIIFGQVKRNNNGSSQIESIYKADNLLIEPKHHVNQSIHVLHTLQDRHFSSVYLMNIRFHLIDLKLSTDYIKAFQITTDNNKIMRKKHFGICISIG